MENISGKKGGIISFVARFVGMQRGRFFFIFLLSLVWSIDATIWPYILGRMIDVFTQFDVNRSMAWPMLKWLLLYIIILWVFVECGFRTRDFLRAKALPQLEADMRMDMFDHIQHHSPRYFNEHFVGTLSNKINDMTVQVSSMLQNLMIFLPTAATCILSVIFLWQINTVFALMLAVWISLHFSICIFFIPKCIKYSNDHGEVRSSLVGKIVDSLSNNFAVNLFFRFRFEKNRIMASQKEEQMKNYLAKRYVAMMFLFLSITFFIEGVALNILMCVFWIKGKISTGEVVQIFNTTWNVILVMWFSSEILPAFFQSAGVVKQALSVMGDPQDVLDPLDASSLEVKQGEIVFENVSFHHGEKKLFTNKNVHIKGGEKVGLVGYSGAGKSTFVNLILRFNEVEEGRILIDEQDIAKVTLESLRSNVCLIPQDPLLFHRSLEENIAYGAIDASKENVVEAAKIACADQFIIKTSNGYNSLVGERGTKLSGGERQRIAIARAVLAKAPILILDEATSALDSITEKQIQIEALMAGRTTIVIAHRLATLNKMDRILVFHEGKIIEEGSHEELLDKGLHYAHMWQTQANGFLPDKPT